MTDIPCPLTLSATAYARGLEHGQALREQIRESITRWKATLPREYGHATDEVIRRFLAATDFVPSMERWTPDVLDEIHGIADGAGLDFETVYAFQLLDELWNNADSIVGEHCTSLGIPQSGSRPTVLAQTVDVEAFRDGHQTVLHNHDVSSGLQAFLVTSAGSIGFNGINHHGIGVCCNAMLQVSSSPTGLPVACVVRGILQQTTLEDAITFVRKVPHASGQNYLIGGIETVVGLECSAHGVVEIQPSECSGVLWHTNHPLSTDDLQPWYREALRANDLHAFVINSRTRLDTLKRRVAKMNDINVESIKSLLASKDDTTHPICSAGLPGELYAEYGMITFAATIMEISSSSRLHVSLGPPDRSAYHVLGFSP